jgi:pimeloyl-ACP methyl ester carboxylesterase
MKARTLQNEVNGAGDPLVLVPGGLTGWLSWMPFVEPLAKKRRVIRVQPIHNELGSAGQRGDLTYTTTIEREALRLTLDELGIESADMVGWSGGGRALITFAVEYPERVRSLALIEPAAYWILSELGRADPEVDRTNTFMHSIAGKDVTDDDLAQFLEIAAFVPSASVAREHPNWERWLPHRNALSWSHEAADRPDLHLDDLTRISAPTLLFKGTVTADWLKRVVDELAVRIPHASVVELEGDHACHIQSMDRFLSELNMHLGRS